jgi:hypothetical protein
MIKLPHSKLVYVFLFMFNPRRTALPFDTSHFKPWSGSGSNDQKSIKEQFISFGDHFKANLYPLSKHPSLSNNKSRDLVLQDPDNGCSTRAHI